MDPSDSDYRYNRGNALYSNQEYDQAIKEYNEAIRLNPFDPDYWRNRGDALYSLEKFDLAIKEFDQAIRWNLSEHDYWRKRAYALKKLNREREADFAIAKAKELGYKG